MSKGKIIAIVIAVCGGLGVLTIGSCAALLYWGFKSADATVAPRIEAMFAAIESGTFPDTYETDTTKEFRDVTTKQQYANIGKAITARLGKLKTKSLQGFNMRQFNADSFVDVTYNAVFEKGNGTIVAKLKRDGGQWEFVSFGVNSSVFAQDIATATCPACGAAHAAAARFCPSCGKALPSDAKTGDQKDGDRKSDDASPPPTSKK